jgi:2-dehydropantoate 2-reductase
MKIAIVGPGAVGLLLAGYLHKTRAAIELVDRSPRRAELLARGIRWQGKDEDFSFTVPVTAGLRAPGEKDLVILCVKAHATEAATRMLSESGYRGALLTLQNGLDNPDIIARNLPASPLLAGVTSEGANLVAHDHVRHAGKGKTSFGPVIPGQPDARFLEELVSLFREAGLDAELSDNPRSLLWSKVLVNAGINALTAILGVQNGRLLEIEPARRLMAALVLEAGEVARRREIGLSYEDPVARAEEVCRLTAENYSSMYMDMKKGRRTEIDSINGAVVREGAAVGLDCPRNQAVTAMVQALELLNRNTARR